MSFHQVLLAAFNKHIETLVVGWKCDDAVNHENVRVTSFDEVFWTIFGPTGYVNRGGLTDGAHWSREILRPVIREAIRHIAVELQVAGGPEPSNCGHAAYDGGVGQDKGSAVEQDFAIARRGNKRLTQESRTDRTRKSS